MRLKIDSTKCLGYGLCREKPPTLIELDECGYASVVGDGDVVGEDAEAVQAAIADCPTQAIGEA